jgi:hypothetical protein
MTTSPGLPTAVLMMRNMGVDGTASVTRQVVRPSIFQMRDRGDQMRVYVCQVVESAIASHDGSISAPLELSVCSCSLMEYRSR